MKIGFIDNYLDEFHANNYPSWLYNASNGKLSVAYVYARENIAPSGMTTSQWCAEHSCENYTIEAVSSIGELIERSDGIIVLSPDHPQYHEELCRLPLASGKLCYIDKTFADDAETAKRIFANADAHHTPCFSTSALRFASEYKDLPQGVTSIASRGPGSLPIYAIHQLEPIIMLMGPDANRVKFIGTEDFPAAVIEFDDGRRATMSHHGWETQFSMAVDFGEHSRDIAVASDYFGLFIQQLADFFLTGDVKVPHEQTISVIAVREALIAASKRPDEWIEVKK